MSHTNHPLILFINLFFMRVWQKGCFNPVVPNGMSAPFTSFRSFNYFRGHIFHMRLHIVHMCNSKRYRSDEWDEHKGRTVLATR